MADRGANSMDAGSPSLAKAFEILSQAPHERLLSLTYKMGHKSTEELVCSMCLILLKRHREAHDRLTANTKSNVGNHLVEMIKMHGEHLNHSHFGNFTSTDPSFLLEIARVFAVLVQERLCDKSLRDQAYCTSLALSRSTGLQNLDVEEEVKQVCGPDVVEKSNTEFSGATYNLTSINEPENSLNPQPGSGLSSYTLEISSPTTINEDSHPLSLHTPANVENQDRLQSFADKSTNICPNNQPQMTNVADAMNSKQCQDHSGTSQIVTSKNSNSNFSTTTTKDAPKLPNVANHATSFHTRDSLDIDETFYAFVILHEAEDVDEAQRLKDKIEQIVSGIGATFSDDFAQPGRSILQCLEDAIENSAFTLLLLTENFKSDLSRTSTDSAIMNSLENHHKLNSVIPLLPRENRLSCKSFPLVLQTKVPLDESSRGFERKALKAISPHAVEKQKKIWMENLRLKRLHEEKRRLQEEKIRREAERLARLGLESDPSSFDSPTSFGSMAQLEQRQLKPSYIHIENAQNIMIGNHGTMNIEHAAAAGSQADSYP